MEYLILFLSVMVAMPMVDALGRHITQGRIDIITVMTGAFMFGILIFHMLPDIYAEGDAPLWLSGIFVCLGLLTQGVLDFFTSDIEGHGIHQGNGCRLTSLTRAMFIGLCIHTFAETLSINAGESFAGGWHGFLHLNNAPLLWGIALHTVPMAIIVYIFMKRTGMPLRRARFLIFVFALSGPAGVALGGIIPFINDNASLANAFVTGILLHISAELLFDTHRGSRGGLSKLSLMVAGFAAAFLITI